MSAVHAAVNMTISLSALRIQGVSYLYRHFSLKYTKFLLGFKDPLDK
jgi:hypothetical protein